MTISGSGQLIADQTLRIRRIIRAITREDQSVDDIAQECFIRILEKEHLWDPNRGSRESWINALTRNLTLNILKSRRPTVALPDELVAPTQDATFNEEHIAWVFRQFSSLPPRQREVLQLKYFEGLSSAEVARRLKIDASTVSEHLNKSLATLRKRARSQGLMATLLPWNWNLDTWIRKIFMSAKVKFAMTVAVIGSIGFVGYQANQKQQDMLNTEQDNQMAARTQTQQPRHKPIPTIPAAGIAGIAENSTDTQEPSLKKNKFETKTPSEIDTIDDLLTYIVSRWNFDENKGHSASMHNGALLIHHNEKIVTEIESFLRKLRENRHPNSEASVKNRLFNNQLDQIHRMASGKRKLSQIVRDIEDNLKTIIQFNKLKKSDPKIVVQAGTTYREILKDIQSKLENETNGILLRTNGVIQFQSPPSETSDQLIHIDVSDFLNDNEKNRIKNIQLKPADILELVVESVLLPAEVDETSARIEGNLIYIKCQPGTHRQVAEMLHWMLQDMKIYDEVRFKESLEIPLEDENLKFVKKTKSFNDITKFLDKHYGLSFCHPQKYKISGPVRLKAKISVTDMLNELVHLTESNSWVRIGKKIILIPKGETIEVSYPIGDLLSK